MTERKPFTMWNTYETEKQKLMEVGFKIRIYYYVQDSERRVVMSLTDYDVIDGWPARWGRIDGIMPLIMSSEYDAYYEADLLMQQTPSLWKDIPRKLVIKPEVKKLIACRSMTQEQVDVMDSYTFSELKRAVKTNYYPVSKIKNKKMKKSWVQPLLDVKTWGFRVFRMKIDLPDDLYGPIRDYL